MATKIKHLKVGGTTYDLAATTADSMGEANLTWGGKNFAGSFGPIDAAMIPRLGANRFAFAEPGGITVEYSTNGGSTWTDYGATDKQKLALTSTGNVDLTVGKRTAAGTCTINDQLRITIDTHLCGIYSELNKFCIYLSTEGCGGCTCTIDVATHAAPTNFSTITTANLLGWSGYNIINTSNITTYGNSDYQYQKLRFTFKVSSVNTSYKGLTIFSIFAFGGVGWSAPSTLSKTGNIYTYDEYKNVTFPKQVTATQFNGNATGLVDAGNGSQITANYSASGMPYSSVSWLAAWNGYSLQSISKNEFVGNNADSVSAALNKLNSGNATPSGADYYICQSANGGTTDTTYYRRPVSALWNYIKGQSDNVYVAKGTIATSSVAGLVKPVSVITKPTINSTTTTSGRYYSVQMSSDGAMFVNVPWQAVPADYYHSTGSWNGLTYTATAHEGAPELKFTLPTGTTATTVARGDHTHSQYVTSDSKTSSSNTTAKIYLVGPTSQSSSGQTTYSNISCYASGGYLYSNGKKVDMDSISGGVEWGTF